MAGKPMGAVLEVPEVGLVHLLKGKVQASCHVGSAARKLKVLFMERLCYNQGMTVISNQMEIYHGQSLARDTCLPALQGGASVRPDQRRVDLPV